MFASVFSTMLVVPFSRNRLNFLNYTDYMATESDYNAGEPVSWWSDTDLVTIGTGLLVENPRNLRPTS